MVYCIALQRLLDNGYVDGELVYLQKLAVSSTMDPDLRICQFCMGCGFPLSSHDYDASGCLVMRNMTALNKLQKRKDDRYIFNLELTTTMKGRRTGDPENPEPFRIYRCPYCSEHYEYEPKSTVT